VTDHGAFQEIPDPFLPLGEVRAALPVRRIFVQAISFGHILTNLSDRSNFLQAAFQFVSNLVGYQRK
jgi:hypothetical protein